MNRKLSTLAAIAVFGLLCSCSAAGDVQSSLPVSAPPAASTPAETAPLENEAEESIKEYLSGLGYEVVKTKSSKTMMEFMLTLSGFSDQVLTEPPEDWEEIRSNLIDAEVAAEEEAPDMSIVVYLQDADGNNYLTVSGGKERYSAFKAYSGDGSNPSTITLDEYNAIKTGMSFQEVYDIVGGAGEVISEVDLGLGEEYRTVMQQWEGVGSLGANANVTFQGGKVTSKAQFGLE